MPGFDSGNLLETGLHGLLGAVRLQVIPGIPPTLRYRIDPPDPATNEILNGGFTVQKLLAEVELRSS